MEKRAMKITVVGAVLIVAAVIVVVLVMGALAEFRALGIDFISYTEGVDTTTPSGELLFHIMGAVAQFERDLIAERVRAGIAHARALGKHIGRPRACVDLEKVVALRNDGKSLRKIAVELCIPVSRVRRALAHSKPEQRQAQLIEVST